MVMLGQIHEVKAYSVVWWKGFYHDRMVTSNANLRETSLYLILSLFDMECSGRQVEMEVVTRKMHRSTYRGY